MKTAVTLVIGCIALLLASRGAAQEKPNPPAQEKPIPVGTAPADTAEEAPAETPVETLVETPPPLTDPELIRIHLMDGSMIAGKLSVQEIEVETPFGNLLVPVTAIHSFTPGLASHPEVARNIEALIEDLGSSNYGRRDAAQKELVKLGPSVRGELAARSDDSDAERRSRIKTILEEFDTLEEDAEEGGAATQVLIRRDTIETADFTIVGQIVPQAFTIASQYGSLSVKLSDIRRGERDSAPRDIQKTVRVGGAHLVQRAMLNTGLRIERGDRVLISAEGTMTMTPWGNEARTGPDGAANFGWFLPNQIANGTLVYKVGSAGQVEKAGSRASFTAERAGTLQLGIGMDANYSNNNFPGEYKVKVRIERK